MPETTSAVVRMSTLGVNCWLALRFVKSEQRCKKWDTCPEVCCVEFYPAERDVVNERNRRHLWEMPMRPPLRRY